MKQESSSESDTLNYANMIRQCQTSWRILEIRSTIRLHQSDQDNLICSSEYVLTDAEVRKHSRWSSHCPGEADTPPSSLSPGSFSPVVSHDHEALWNYFHANIFISNIFFVPSHILAVDWKYLISRHQFVNTGTSSGNKSETNKLINYSRQKLN